MIFDLYEDSSNSLSKRNLANEKSLPSVDWEAQMDALERRQEDIFNNQLRLLPKQVESLMRAVSQMRIELTEVKEAASQDHIESVVQQALAEFIGETADKHKEISDQQRILNEQGQAIESFTTALSDLRGEVAEIKEAASKGPMIGQHFVEFAGESTEKHKETTDQQHILNDQLMEALSRMRAEVTEVKEAVSKEHMESVIQQILAEFIGESADKHKAIVGQHEDFKTTTETHLEHIEGLIRDSADKHCVEISSAFAKIDDLYAGIESCTWVTHQSAIENRLDSLEKNLSEFGDARGCFNVAVETRLQSLEKLLGDTLETSRKDFERI